MSPRLRFFGSLAAGRLSSRRISAGSARRLVHHQSRNLADDAGRSGRFFSARRGSTVAAITLSSALVGTMLYFRQGKEEQPTAAGMKRIDLPTPTWPPAWPTLEEVIAEEKDEEKEAALKAMFEEWMVEYKRRYGSEEEKTMRYREFKRTVKFVEKANARRLNGGAWCGPNCFADSTDEERLRRRGSEREPDHGAIYRCFVNWWVQRGRD